MFTFERERETECEQGEGQREGDKEAKAGARLWAVSTEPDAELELTSCEIVTWAEDSRLTDWATQEPLEQGHFNGRSYDVDTDAHIDAHYECMLIF